ncbi:hypothetical protein [Streptomyces sp. NBC_00280]|uniref:hypothetical protein n=1 Tax=Streptomyces sp. NBC_00280 TaxID=2975699 RepID=UPI003246409D
MRTELESLATALRQEAGADAHAKNPQAEAAAARNLAEQAARDAKISYRDAKRHSR